MVEELIAAVEAATRENPVVLINDSAFEFETFDVMEASIRAELGENFSYELDFNGAEIDQPYVFTITLDVEDDDSKRVVEFGRGFIKEAAVLAAYLKVMRNINPEFQMEIVLDEATD